MAASPPPSPSDVLSRVPDGFSVLTGVAGMMYAGSLFTLGELLGGLLWDLIPAARAARTTLANEGRSLSRDNLADAMRNDGHGDQHEHAHQRQHQRQNQTHDRHQFGS